MIDCKTTEKYIPEFLNDELEPMRLKEFLLHVDKCPECKEELSIQFLVTEGLNTLETGNSYNLKEEYNERISKSWRIIRFHRRLVWFRDTALILVGATLVAGIVWIHFMFF